MKTKLLLTIALLFCLWPAFSNSQSVEVIKQVTLDLPEYVDEELGEIDGTRLTAWYYDSLNKNYYGTLNFASRYLFEKFDSNGYTYYYSGLVKLDSNFNVCWLQSSFFGKDTISGISTFSFDEKGNITLGMMYRPIDSNIVYSYLAGLTLNSEGEITSKSFLECKDPANPADDEVIYSLRGVGAFHQKTNNKKYRDGTLFQTFVPRTLLSDSTTFFYQRFNPFTVESKKVDHAVVNFHAKAFLPTENGNLLVFFKTHTGFPCNYAIYDTTFTRISEADISGVFKKFGPDMYGSPDARVTSEAISVVILKDTLSEAGERIYEYEQFDFDKKTGEFLGQSGKISADRGIERRYISRAGRFTGFANSYNNILKNTGTGEVDSNAVFRRFSIEKDGKMLYFPLDTFRTYEVSWIHDEVRPNTFLSGGFIQYPELNKYNEPAGLVFIELIKYNPEPQGIDDSEIEGKNMPDKLWVFNTYPNPARNSVVLDFYCRPGHLKDLSVEIYDAMGQRFTQKVDNYEIISYDTRIGDGKMKVDLSGVGTGPRYIMLKVQGDSYTTGVISK